MIIVSKSIFDGIVNEPYEGAIVIEGDLIKEVIKNYNEYILPDDEVVIDVGEKTVMAGFCDNHVHVFLAGLDIATCNIAGTSSEEDAAKKLYDFYKNRDDEWIIGFGWSHYDWPGEKLPSKHSLDKYFPDRPAMLINDELHAVWVNSKALKECNVDKTIIDPEYGHIEKDDNGDPTGYVLEQSAMMLFSQKALESLGREDREFVKKFIEKAHSKGVTSVGDMEIIGIMKNEVYKEMEENDELDLRIFFSPSINKSLEEFKEIREKCNSDNLALLGAKGFVDGTPLGHTGLMVEDYADMPGNRGEPVLDLKYLNDKVDELNKEGISVRLHACGDGAVRAALDSFENSGCFATNKNLRNSIEHIECIHKTDIKRLQKTSTIASIQPNHMTMDTFEDHPIFSIVGKERSELAWPTKTLSDTGACVALGTDCPIVPLDPMTTLYCAVNRVMEDGMPVGGWNRKEKYSVAEALKGMTVNCAYLFNMQDKIGTLEAGKYADVIVLSENVFKCSELNLKKIEVEFTIWNGKKVYEKGGQNE